MRHWFLCLIAGGWFQTTLRAQQACPIIPQPLRVTTTGQTFVLNQNTSLVTNQDSLASVALYLQQQLLMQQQMPLALQPQAPGPAIQLSIVNKGRGNEAYSLEMSAQNVQITAETIKGAFYGVISFLQLTDQGQKEGNNIRLPCWNLNDRPRYEWRGVMLDESRHFFGVEKVKSILNWMAYYKLNRFHWHLTDEPAWRIEIKRYPKLALIGGIGNYTHGTAPAKYYTQQQIAEIIHYAALRHITVIPEIDMPGHATAANRAYPQHSGGGSDKHPEFTFHPGKESTYLYLTGILREVNALFPAKMIHLGGDEVSFGNDKWLADEAVKKLMARQHLTTVTDVERYFMQRMADSVFNMNAKLLAWDEVADMDFPKNKTIVFWWRHDRPAQLNTILNKGYATVLCPRLPLYFDFVQDSTHSVGRKWAGRFSPLEDVYYFNAAHLPGVTSQNQEQILGIQANLWTETIQRSDQLDFMLFPRIAALAEASWRPAPKGSYQQFTTTLKKHIRLYKKEDINFYTPFKN